eukprot:Tbor_TRINITY_DN4017_c0_g1::TRINITY_DN4017_c0_g1_i1::g.11681::m.11681
MLNALSFVGVTLHAFSPSILLVIYWTVAVPQMVIVALSGAFAAIIAQILTSVVYQIGNSISPDGYGLGISHDGRIGSGVGGPFLYSISSIIFQELIRFLLIFGLYHVEIVFRRRGQSLVGTVSRTGTTATPAQSVRCDSTAAEGSRTSSHCLQNEFKLFGKVLWRNTKMTTLPMYGMGTGTCLSGLALGLGFGTMRSVMIFGTALNTAANIEFNGVMGYDVDMCPVMPIMMYQSIMALCQILAQMAWSVVLLQAVSAILFRREMNRLMNVFTSNNNNDSIEMNHKNNNNKVNSTSKDDELSSLLRETISSPNTDERQPHLHDSKEANNINNSNKSNNGRLAAQKALRPFIALAPPSSLSPYQCTISIASVFVLHYLLSLLPIIAIGAVHSSNNNNCTAVIPLVVVTTVVSVVLGMWCSWTEKKNFV